jgi:hypothetical protein
LGLKQRHAVIAIYAATSMAAGLGLIMMVREDAGSLVVFGCILLLLVLLFRVVGAVKFKDTLLRLQAKHTVARREKREKQAFEYSQLRFRRVHGFPQWWQAVCEAARRLDFLWVSLTVTNPDGSEDMFVWRREDAPPKTSRVVTVSLPLKRVQERTMGLEIAVAANGSLESASNRASLFSRLVDEHNAGPWPHAVQADSCKSKQEGEPAKR